MPPTNQNCHGNALGGTYDADCLNDNIKQHFMGILEDVRNIFLNLKIENLGRATDLQDAKFLLPDCLCK